MNYGNVPSKVLKLYMGEDYYDGEYTLKQELDRIGQDIIYAEWELTKDKECIISFTAWTKYFVVIMATGVFGDKNLIYADRNPPSSFLITTKKRGQRSHE
jgi:hypothetical protein